MKIGLEVHIYPRTDAKMYCACPADILGAEPNTLICPICTGQPGAKPMGINRRAVEAGLQVAISAGSEIASGPVVTKRKHYFYPDLPNNYQRTSEPFASRGSFRGVALWEIHWEEDPGQYELKKGEVDYNRSGTPLLEMVTAPDMKSPAEAASFLRDLRLLLDYLGLMREGSSFKCDANVSLEGTDRVEIKNLNSIKAVEDSLTFEAQLIAEMVARNEPVRRVTKHYDDIFNRTIQLREKESADDYRYMKDPDIPAVRIGDAWVADVRKRMPEDPFAIIERLAKAGIAEDAARTLLSDRALYESYAKVAASTDAKTAADFYVRDIIGELNYRSLPFSKAHMGERAVIDLVKAVTENRVTRLLARELLRGVLDRRIDEAALAKELEGGFSEDALEKAIDEVLTEEAESVAKYRAGKKEVAKFLLGMVMKKVKKKGDPREIARLLQVKLDG